MSKLSYIHSSYGKPFSIAVANTYSFNVLNSTNLPSNTLIVASPIDSTTYEDLGMHSLLVTDFEGNAVRLTYNIATGNGLVENKDGSIELRIDNKTIKENESGQLYADLAYFVEANGFEISNGKLSITTATMQKASDKKFGVFKVDGTTIVANNGVLYANTSKLDLSDNNSNTFGIIYSESQTIKARNGVLSIDTESLEKSNETTYGITKVDGNLIVTNNGVISLDTNKLSVASTSQYGLTDVDNTTIVENTDRSISINNSGLRKASSTLAGIVKGDNVTTETRNGTLSIKNYSTLQQSILNIGENISALNLRIDEIENLLKNYSQEITSPTIFTFVCDGLSSATLVKPEEYGEVPEKMPVQKVSASFIVNTNCPFKISLQYIDNVDPEITLYEINYDDVDKYPGVVGLTRTYQSTKEKDVKITLSWLCKNYRTNKNTEYSNKTRIILKVMFTNDITISKEVKYSITRFNSLYNEKIDYNGQNDEIIIDKYKNKINKHLVNYLLKVRDSSKTDQFLKENNGVWEVSENYLNVTPIMTKDGNVSTSNSQVLVDIDRGTNATILSYIDGINNSERPITKQQIANGRILIDTYSVDENGNETLINDQEAKLTVDNHGNIVLIYGGGYEQTDNNEYYIEVIGNGLRQVSDGVYEVVDSSYMYCTYNDNGTIIPQNRDQFIENLIFNRYTEGHENTRQIGNKYLDIVVEEDNKSTNDASMTINNTGVNLHYSGEFTEQK